MDEKGVLNASFHKPEYFVGTATQVRQRLGNVQFFKISNRDGKHRSLVIPPQGGVLTDKKPWNPKPRSEGGIYFTTARGLPFLLNGDPNGFGPWVHELSLPDDQQLVGVEPVRLNGKLIDTNHYKSHTVKLGPRMSLFESVVWTDPEIYTSIWNVDQLLARDICKAHINFADFWRQYVLPDEQRWERELVRATTEHKTCHMAATLLLFCTHHWTKTHEVAPILFKSKAIPRLFAKVSKTVSEVVYSTSNVPFTKEEKKEYGLPKYMSSYTRIAKMLDHASFSVRMDTVARMIQDGKTDAKFELLPLSTKQLSELETKAQKTITRRAKGEQSHLDSAEWKDVPSIMQKILHLPFQARDINILSPKFKKQFFTFGTLERCMFSYKKSQMLHLLNAYYLPLLGICQQYPANTAAFANTLSTSDKTYFIAYLDKHAFHFPAIQQLLCGIDPQWRNSRDWALQWRWTPEEAKQRIQALFSDKKQDQYLTKPSDFGFSRLFSAVMLSPDASNIDLSLFMVTDIREEHRKTLHLAAQKSIAPDVLRLWASDIVKSGTKFFDLHQRAHECPESLVLLAHLVQSILIPEWSSDPQIRQTVNADLCTIRESKYAISKYLGVKMEESFFADLCTIDQDAKDQKQSTSDLRMVVDKENKRKLEQLHELENSKTWHERCQERKTWQSKRQKVTEKKTDPDESPLPSDEDEKDDHLDALN